MGLFNQNAKGVSSQVWEGGQQLVGGCTGAKEWKKKNMEAEPQI